MDSTIGATPLPRSTPEAEGLPSAAVLAFVNGLEERVPGMHSLMLLRHGKVLAEGWWAPYTPQDIHLLFSLSKSFTSTAAGLAIAEGRFSLDDTVLSFFSEDAPAERNEHLQAMRVRHLLSMSTGHTSDTTAGMRADAEGNWTRAFLAQAPEKEPGTHFLYNNGATYMVAAIVQKVTGQTVLEYLKPRMLGPLGIVGATWESSPQGVNYGGWGLSVRTEDIARFGQLYLQDGVWEGKRLLPEGWVADATAKHVSNGDDPNNDWNQGYGFQFWRCRHSAYRGDGAFGQFCVVMPEQDAVLAVTAGIRDMGAVLALTWEHLLPAFSATALLPELATQATLTERLSHLRLSAPEGAASSPQASAFSGRTYNFAPGEENERKIETVTLDFAAEGGTVLQVRNAHGEHILPIGELDEWRKGETNLLDPAGSRIATTGAWANKTTYVAAICLYETPFVLTYTFHFEEDGAQVALGIRQNVGFGPTESKVLIGKVD